MTLTVPHVRGVVSSFIQLFSSLVGFGAGPFVTGVLSDALPGGLRSAFAVIFTVNIWAAAHYLLAVRAVRKLEPFSQNP
jgi:MFS family permease